MSIKPKFKMETYNFFIFWGLLLGVFGAIATSILAIRVDYPLNALWLLLTILLILTGPMLILTGLIGTLMHRKLRTLTKRKLQEISKLSQNLKVRYPTYVLKVYKLKEKHETLHKKFQEVRTHSEEFKERIKAFQTGLTELETQLHNNLRKYASIMDNVDGVAKKILWSEKQLELTYLDTSLKTLVETENPMGPEHYLGILNQIQRDFKKLDAGVTGYHELLTACTRAPHTFDTVEALKTNVEEIDALISHLTSQHEAELLKLETDTQTRYEMSEMALSIFQERFREFKVSCEFFLKG